MSKFQPIRNNRLGNVQYRSIKQVLEQHKQDECRIKEHKCEPLCDQKYENPYMLHDSKIENEDTEQDEKTNDDLPLHDHPNVHVELPVIYDTPKTNDDVKPVEVETEVENIRTELVRKQSLKDVVKLSYKHFLNKEFTV
ncbi:MAG: hypothetical protein RLZZ293_1371 [Pseudomonadota bacterium]|jgi:hypothetical protein